MYAATQLLRVWLITTAISAIVGQKHRFLRQPFNSTVRYGNTVILRCAVENMQTSVQWSVDGFALGRLTDERLSFQGNRMMGEYNLRIRDAQLTDDGEYRCLVHPDANKGLSPLMSRAAYLNVLVPPSEIEMEPAMTGTINVKAMGSVTVKCSVPNTKPASDIKWRVGGREYNAGVIKELFPGSEKKLTNTSSSITLRPTKLENGTVVECIVRHPAMEAPVSKAATINVLYPPNPPRISGFDTKPMKSGQKLNVRCEVEGGNPKAKITWLIGHEVIPGEYQYTTSGAVSVLTHELRPQDDGKILSCRAESIALDEPLEAQYKITVYYPPESLIIEREPKEGTPENGAMQFACSFRESNPKASLSWYIGDVKLVPQWTENVGAIPYMIHGSEDASRVKTSLTLTTVRRQDAELIIKCRASIPAIEYTEEVLTQPKVNFSPRKVNISIFSLSPPITVPYEDGQPRFLPNSGDVNSKLVYKVGDVVMLKCQAKGGNPPPNLNWFIDDVPVTTDEGTAMSAPDVKVQTLRNAPDAVYGEFLTMATLELTLKSHHNGATVSCVAGHSGYKSTLADKLSLKVAFPPNDLTIEHFPSSPVAGKPMSLTCKTSSSYPAARISWYRNNVKLPSSYSISLPHVQGSLGGLVAASRLQITPTPEDDGTSYACGAEVEILQATVTKSYKLQIEYPPMFYPMNGNATSYNATEGDNYIDIVAVTRANPRQTSFMWFRIVPVKTDSGGPTIMTKVALTKDRRFVWRGDKGTLRINNPRKEDGGMYTIRATNTRGTTELNITLNVFYTPRIVRISGPTENVKEGDSTSLRCDFRSHPLTPSKVTWVKEVPGNGRPEYNVRTYPGYSVLTLDNLTAEDRGGYKCIVDNGIGDGDFRHIVLQMTHSPVFASYTPRKVAVSAVGEDGTISPSAVLPCTVYSSPAAVITWKKGNTTITGTDDRYSILQDVVNFETTRSTLTVNSIDVGDPVDSGVLSEFSCVAANDRGERSMSIQIVLNGPPDPPHSLNAYNVSDTAVYLTWTQGFNGGVPQYFVVQFKKRFENNNRHQFKEKVVQRNSGSVENLEHNQEYLFRVVAKNEFGQSVPSETITVKTTLSLKQDTSGTTFGVKRAYVVIFAVVSVVIFVFVIGVAALTFRRCKISNQSYRPKTIETDCESLTHAESSLSSRGSSAKRYECEKLVAETRDVSKGTLTESGCEGRLLHGEAEVHPLENLDTVQSCYFDCSSSRCSSHHSMERTDVGVGLCGSSNNCTFSSFKRDPPRADPSSLNRFNFGSQSVRIQRPITEERIPRKCSEPRFRFDVVPTEECLSYDRPLDLPLPPALPPYENRNYTTRTGSSLDVRDSSCAYFGNPHDFKGDCARGSYRQFCTLQPSKYGIDSCYQGCVDQLPESRTSFANPSSSIRQKQPASSADSTETCLYNYVSRPSDGYATSLLTMPGRGDYISPDTTETRIRSSQSSSSSDNGLYTRSLDNMMEGMPKQRPAIVNEDGSINTFGLDFPPPPLDVIRESQSQDPLTDCQNERPKMFSSPSAAEERFIGRKSSLKGLREASSNRAPTSSVRFRDELSKALSNPRPGQLPVSGQQRISDHSDDDTDSGCGGSADVHVHSEPSPLSPNKKSDSTFSPVSSISEEGMVLRV